MGPMLATTRSICPVCYRSLPAERVRLGSRVYLRRHCPEHGETSALVWGGEHLDITDWIGTETPWDVAPGCPDACGLCGDHQQGTCCVLLEVTRRCNLECPRCFADSTSQADPTLAQVDAWVKQLTVPGRTLLQLSGGEPTLRDDLPEIVALARAEGCSHVQLNTNGIRLAADPDYVARLAAAGLSFVFLQFDGTDDEVYSQLRGRALLETKCAAIDACARHNVGVTLVPTLVPGINVSGIGDILRFAVSHSPAVRGVHFQPVTSLGRTPRPPCDDDRLPLDALVTEIARQADGLVPAGSLTPSRCDHPLCGFHGDFVVSPDGSLAALSRRQERPAACCATRPEQNRLFVARRWKRPDGPFQVPASRDMASLDGFASRVKTHGFTITAMAFQDAYTLDVHRLRRCSLHVFDEGRLVPFCSYYLRRGTRP